VPSAFGTGVIVPLVKDRNGPHDKLSNYRGITLSPVISKLFEVCLSEKFSHNRFTQLLIYYLVLELQSRDV